MRCMTLTEDNPAFDLEFVVKKAVFGLVLVVKGRSGFVLGFGGYSSLPPSFDIASNHVHDLLSTSEMTSLLVSHAFHLWVNWCGRLCSYFHTALAVPNSVLVLVMTLRESTPVVGGSSLDDDSVARGARFVICALPLVAHVRSVSLRALRAQCSCVVRAQCSCVVVPCVVVPCVVVCCESSWLFVVSESRLPRIFLSDSWHSDSTLVMVNVFEGECEE